MKNKFTLGVIIFCLTAIVASVLSCIFAGEIVITIISTTSTLIGLAGLIIGFNLDRNISEASFLLDLHKPLGQMPMLNELQKSLSAFF